MLAVGCQCKGRLHACVRACVCRSGAQPEGASRRACALRDIVQVEQEMGPAPPTAGACASAASTAPARPKSKAPPQPKRAGTGKDGGPSSSAAPAALAALEQQSVDEVVDEVEDEGAEGAGEQGCSDGDAKPAHAQPPQDKKALTVHVSVPAPAHASEGDADDEARAGQDVVDDQEQQGARRVAGCEGGVPGAGTPRHHPAPPSNNARSHGGAYAGHAGGRSGPSGGGLTQRRKKRAKVQGGGGGGRYGKATLSENSTTSKASFASDSSMVSKVR